MTSNRAKKTSKTDKTNITLESLKNKNAKMEKAIKVVLGYISSHQVYDKDAKSILVNALSR